MRILLPIDPKLPERRIKMATADKRECTEMATDFSEPNTTMRILIA